MGDVFIVADIQKVIHALIVGFYVNVVKRMDFQEVSKNLIKNLNGLIKNKAPITTVGAVKIIIFPGCTLPYVFSNLPA